MAVPVPSATRTSMPVPCSGEPTDPGAFTMSCAVTSRPTPAAAPGEYRPKKCLAL